MNWYEAMQEARAHGITRAAMAGELGIHPDTLARWERDERTVEPNWKASYDAALYRQMMALEQQRADKSLEGHDGR